MLRQNCVTLPMLTGPLFMLQVYDWVLGPRSEETLVALFILAAAQTALLQEVAQRGPFKF